MGPRPSLAAHQQHWVGEHDQRQLGWESHPMKVDRTATPLTELEVANVLQQAWIALFGQMPTSQVLGVGWAQIALENDHGRAIWNNNFGNITTAGHSGDFYELQTKEQIHPGDWKEVTMKYAAHTTPEDGAEAYWKLVTGAHYAPAFRFFETGEAHAAAMELHALGYFTANAEPIALSFARLYDHFL